jgi:single-strand DNA-binding protein
MSIPTISDIAGIIAAPELKHTNTGKAILNVRLAFNDSKYDEQQSKWVNTKTFYVDGQAWEQTAERLYDQLQQGDQVYVTGRIETQSWEKDGEKKSKPVLNIVAARKLAKNDGGQQRQQARQPAQGQGWNQQPANVPDPAWGGSQTEPPF